MAQRDIIPDGEGALGDIPPITISEDGKLSETMVNTLSNALRGIIKAINGRLSMGNGLTGHRTGNLDGQWIDVLTPAVANTEFVVPHGLKRVPVAAVPLKKDRAVDIYDSSAGSWSDSLIYLKASVASATVKLWVF